jgi:hypothetical protein
VGRLLHEFGEKVALFGQIRTNCTNFTPDLSSGQGHAARNGTPDLGKKDCHHCFDCVEERGVLRRQSSETTNSLSVSDRVRSILGIFDLL